MQHIEEWIQSLQRSFGPPREQVDTKEMEALHLRDEFTKLVGQVRKTMIPVPMRLRVGYSQNLSSPAKVAIPAPFPPLNTTWFRDHVFTLYIQKGFMASSPAKTFIATLAHEFGHIVLESVGHQHRDEEKCVDLVSMYFGYGEVLCASMAYSAFDRTAHRDASSFSEFLDTFLQQLSSTGLQRSKIGYLSEQEAAYALQVIQRMRE